MFSRQHRAPRRHAPDAQSVAAQISQPSLNAGGQHSHRQNGTPGAFSASEFRANVWGDDTREPASPSTSASTDDSRRWPAANRHRAGRPGGHWTGQRGFDSDGAVNCKCYMDNRTSRDRPHPDRLLTGPRSPGESNFDHHYFYLAASALLQGSCARFRPLFQENFGDVLTSRKYGLQLATLNTSNGAQSPAIAAAAIATCSPQCVHTRKPSSRRSRSLPRSP